MMYALPASASPALPLNRAPDAVAFVITTRVPVELLQLGDAIVVASAGPRGLLCDSA